MNYDDDDDDCEYDHADPLRPVQGILIGLLLSGVLWYALWCAWKAYRG
jgi:hypothetical protein